MSPPSCARTNRVNGAFACGNESTLTRILRDEIGFKGFVTSDWGAVHSVSSINAGLDMEMPGDLGAAMPIPSYFDSKPAVAPSANFGADMMEGFFSSIPEEPKPTFDMGNFGKVEDSKKMPEALKDGTVTKTVITRAAGRVLHEIVQFGYLDGQSKHEVTQPPIEANARIIERTGEEAAVLLKNDGGALPLKTPDLDDLVLIGPTAGQVDSIGISGERAVGLPERQVGPYDALKKISGNTKIQFAVDNDMTGSIIPAALLSHDGVPGLRRTGDGDDKVDATLDFTLKRGNALKANSTITWKGTLTVPSCRQLLDLPSGPGHQCPLQDR